MTGRIAVVAIAFGLQLVGAVQLLSAQRPFRSRCGAGVHEDAKRGFIVLPQGEIFCQLIADPKAPSSFASYLRGDFATIASPVSDAETNIASVGLGDSFGLFRIEPSGLGNGVQFGIVGAIFAQFNLDRPSFDLINADYVVGLPLTYRYRAFSGRLQLYHQSSHLGDEFLLAVQPERENLSFEALELILSVEAAALRLYAGGESFFRRRPDIAVVSQLGHAGAELRPIMFGDTRIVLAADLKVIEQVDWKTAWSTRAGFEIARIPSPGHPARLVSILAQYYNGPAPYGQFYRDDIQNIGVGIHFSLQ
jgi:hypothetical protein